MTLSILSPAIAALLTFAVSAAAAPVQQPHSQAELIAERDALVPGDATALGLRLRLEDGWHVYWKNPGDAGMATSITWTLPADFSAGPLQWPAPRRIDSGPLTSYGYDGEVLLITDVRAPRALAAQAPVTLRATADWLVCKDICIPATATFELRLPVTTSPPPPDTRNADAFAKARAALPVKGAGWNAEAYRIDGAFLLRLAPPPDAPALRSAQFFPDHPNVIAHAGKQIFSQSRKGNAYDLHVPVAAGPTGAVDRLAGVVVLAPPAGTVRAIEVELPLLPGPGPAAEPPAPAGPALGLAAAIVLALAGGLLLNLMPCVFPVLGLKVLGVLQHAHGNRSSLRVHALLFALGVMLAFWLVGGALLALRAQGAGLGWGYQLQSPAVVAGLALLFFVLALNLSGVFQLGRSVQMHAGAIRVRNPHLDALLSGALVTAVAAPCTAPFMGVALGYAVTQPAGSALLVFSALALGTALPYVVLCLAPPLLRRLPRPGPWMETLKQALAFPLYATVVWLAWVLGQQAGIDAVARLLLALVLTGAGAWAWNRWARAASPFRYAGRAAGALLGLSALVVGMPAILPAASSDAQAWRPWSEQAVDEALAQRRAVFVDFTAAWCVTCQVNKRLVLHAAPVQQRFAELGVVRLRADWTNRDPAITAALARLNRSGVPVYALYSPAAAAPELLPEVLTQQTVLDALGRIAPDPGPRSAMLTNPLPEHP